MQPASRNRIIAIGAFLIGFAGWWYNWHLVKTTGSFYIKLTLLGPLALFTGLLFLFRPEWTGPIRSDSTREHKLALFAGIVFMAVAAGIDFYFLHNYTYVPHP
jgi:hypothetical protein